MSGPPQCDAASLWVPPIGPVRNRSSRAAVCSSGLVTRGAPPANRYGSPRPRGDPRRRRDSFETPVFRFWASAHHAVPFALARGAAVRLRRAGPPRRLRGYKSIGTKAEETCDEDESGPLVARVAGHGAAGADRLWWRAVRHATGTGSLAQPQRRRDPDAECADR